MSRGLLLFSLIEEAESSGMRTGRCKIAAQLAAILDISATPIVKQIE